MSPEHDADVRPVGQIEGARLLPIAIDENASSAKSVISPRQIYALMAYYMALLIGSIALMVLIILKADLAQEKSHLLASMGFLVSGAIVGSVLYQIRMLFRFYIKYPNFDSRWLGKYISAPVEAVALALAILSLIQSGGVVLGGSSFDLAQGKPFAAFGFGALVGFGIREVVGWLGNLAKTTFPTDYKTE